MLNLQVPEHLLLTAIAALFEEMNSGNTTLAGSAAEAIGHAGLRAPLPLPAGDLTSVLALTAEKSSSTTVATAVTGSSKDGLTGKEAPVVAPSVSETPEAGKQEEGLSMALVVKRLASLLASKEVKLVQKAVLAFGHLCFGNRNTELSETALTALFTLSRSKVCLCL